MKNILLIFPHFSERHRVFDEEADLQRRGADKAFMVPISIATVAALTPPHIGVDLWDENVQGIITEKTQLSRKYDLVGVSGFQSHFPRVEALSKLFRGQGIPVVVGGPAASTTPERYVHLADSIFIGEAEYTWPAFIQEWEQGSYRKFYRQVIKPELAVTPVPQWERLGAGLDRYFAGAVQTSRGCPYDCEFCDVPYIFGHRSRWKPVADVIKEIEIQAKLGVSRIFFCDDNFIGDLSYARSLLKELVKFNNSLERPIYYFTQLTLNVARYDDVLEMLADANFAGLFIGIETPNKGSLKETHKLQNVYTDILADVHKIQSYSMILWSGIIVGFDNDTTEIFDEQFEFLQASCIPIPVINLLVGHRGTRLWYRLQREGRLVDGPEDPIVPRANTNVIPMGMSRAELLKGHFALHHRVRNWDNWAIRMKGLISNAKRPPKVTPNKKELRQRKFVKAIVPFLRSPIGDALLGMMELLVKASPRSRQMGRALFSKKARRTLLDVVQHCVDTAPWMFPGTIGPILALQLRQVELLRHAVPRLKEEIEKESAPGYQPKLVEAPICVPMSFWGPYMKVFPDVYARVEKALHDKNRIEEVLIETFTQFLQRWGTGLEALKDFHLEDLYATCDHLVGEENRHPRTGLVTLSPRPTADFRRSKLPEEVLHSVEQELRLRPWREEAPEQAMHAGAF
jgi:radical SAM superfamily enzyme YgiQ (UPF0313 family)